MSNAQDHKIGRIVLQIETSQSPAAWELQAELSQLLHQRGLFELGQLFDRWTPPDQVVRLEELAVELPPLGAQQLADEFVPRLLTALEQALGDRIRLPGSPSASSDSLTQPLPEADWEGLLYFLEYGRLPWWQTDAALSAWLPRWEAAIAGNTPWREPLQQLLARRPEARQRLVEALPDPFRQRLIIQLWPAWGDWLTLLPEMRQLLAAQPLTAPTVPYLETQAWLLLLAEMRPGTATAAATRSWLQAWLATLVAIAPHISPHQLRRWVFDHAGAHQALWLEAIAALPNAPAPAAAGDTPPAGSAPASSPPAEHSLAVAEGSSPPSPPAPSPLESRDFGQAGGVAGDAIAPSESLLNRAPDRSSPASASDQPPTSDAPRPAPIDGPGAASALPTASDAAAAQPPVDASARPPAFSPPAQSPSVDSLPEALSLPSTEGIGAAAQRVDRLGGDRTVPSTGPQDIGPQGIDPQDIDPEPAVIAEVTGTADSIAAEGTAAAALDGAASGDSAAPLVEPVVSPDDSSDGDTSRTVTTPASALAREPFPTVDGIASLGQREAPTETPDADGPASAPELTEPTAEDMAADGSVTSVDGAGIDGAGVDGAGVDGAGVDGSAIADLPTGTAEARPPIPPASPSEAPIPASTQSAERSAGPEPSPPTPADLTATEALSTPPAPSPAPTAAEVSAPGEAPPAPPPAAPSPDISPALGSSTPPELTASVAPPPAEPAAGEGMPPPPPEAEAPTPPPPPAAAAADAAERPPLNPASSAAAFPVAPGAAPAPPPAPAPRSPAADLPSADPPFTTTASPSEAPPEGELSVSPAAPPPQAALPGDALSGNALSRDISAEDALPGDVLPEDTLPGDVSAEDALAEDGLSTSAPGAAPSDGTALTPSNIPGPARDNPPLPGALPDRASAPLSAEAAAPMPGGEPSATAPLAHPLMANPPRQDPSPTLSRAEQANGIYLNGAGLVLLHPFLRIYFEDVGLLADDAFRHEHAQQVAIRLVHYLATGQTTAPEYQLVLPKLLCGWPLNDPVSGGLELPDSALAEGEHLLETVINYWEALKNTSPDGLREGFLQRQGKLTRTNRGDWKLRVEQQAIDILLSRLPWGLSMVKLPWMADVLGVEWT